MLPQGFGQQINPNLLALLLQSGQGSGTGGPVMSGPMQGAPMAQQQAGRPMIGGNMPMMQQPSQPPQTNGLLSVLSGQGDNGQALGLLKMIAQGAQSQGQQAQAANGMAMNPVQPGQQLNGSPLVFGGNGPMQAPNGQQLFNTGQPQQQPSASPQNPNLPVGMGGNYGATPSLWSRLQGIFGGQ